MLFFLRDLSEHPQGMSEIKNDSSLVGSDSGSFRYLVFEPGFVI